MKIVADENIPFVKEAFGLIGEVTTLPGRGMQARDLEDCEILLVRSVTHVDEALIGEAPLRFVASATIGTDHVDLDYLKRRGIGFANAPGCNAESASEYVIAALFHLSAQKGFDPFSLRAGIVGHGNVGSRVRQKLEHLGIETLLNDPPKQRLGQDAFNYVSLQTLIDECDFITCHVPLTRDGRDPTWHLLDRQRLAELRPGCILFNAARGAVVDNPALSDLLDRRGDLNVFLDTWEGEPQIDLELMYKVDLASPHIAGYSVEGRLRGTQMIHDALCRHLGIESHWFLQDHLPPAQALEAGGSGSLEDWQRLFAVHYPIGQDDAALRALAAHPERAATDFDRLRKHYPARYEYPQFIISADATNDFRKRLQGLGFRLSE